ncbi:S41 family peptidase [Kangiella sediminilitoris]|uniref:Carboxyl-terminal protease n=1 Tax=Kangiella sediminilitoris TaxID=1144748 RepID=A0A1B3B899_9GAMM|nr:S41 family peptidase [Kangiella sediminilitoris]AOE49034.1 Carboxyl-terminal protease [Kangiella sediminilitoris]
MLNKLATVLLLCLFITGVAFADHPEKEQSLQEPTIEEQESGTSDTVETLPLDELAALADAYAQIKQSYVKELTDKEILDAAIRGMLSNLDPYSTYLTAEQFAALQESATGDYAGIGIEANHIEEGIEVVNVFKDSPAERSGLKPGDLITHINDISAAGLPAEEGSELMRGSPGSKVELTYINSDEEEVTVVVTRQVIHTTSVTYQLLEDNIGFARITEFQLRTANDLSQAISNMEYLNKKPLAGLILDLRNNPGGLLDGATEVSDLFLNSGVIVKTKGRQEETNEVHNASSGDILRGKPLVVLINGRSASASEIVSGALQDHKRATIIGTQSFGKAMVQTILPIHGGNAIKLTTSLYYTPNDRSIQDSGITPDITVEFEPVDDNNDAKIQTDTKKSGESKGSVTQSYKRDNQVMAALKHIKNSQN